MYEKWIQLLFNQSFRNGNVRVGSGLSNIVLLFATMIKMFSDSQAIRLICISIVKLVISIHVALIGTTFQELKGML